MTTTNNLGIGAEKLHWLYQSRMCHKHGLYRGRYGDCPGCKDEAMQRKLEELGLSGKVKREDDR